MTRENDPEQDAGSDKTIEERMEAEVKDKVGNPENPDAYLIKYRDGTHDYEPSNPVNDLIFDGDIKYTDVVGSFSFAIKDNHIYTHINPPENEWYIEYGGYKIEIPYGKREEVIEILGNRSPGQNVGEELLEIYNEITKNSSRRPVVESFMYRYPNDRVEVTDEGWIIDETFIVKYDASNEIIDVDPKSPHGDLIENSHAIELKINAEGKRKVKTKNGESIVLSEKEQEFLTTIEALLYPEEYFGVELVKEIQQYKTEAEVLDDVIEELTSNASVTAFTDSKTGINHGGNTTSDHSFNKHKLRYIGVSEDVVDHLWSHEYDHSALHEMLMRKSELIARDDINVFKNSHDSNPKMWDKIERTAENAPIPNSVRQKLKGMFK